MIGAITLSSLELALLLTGHLLAGILLGAGALALLALSSPR